MDGSLIVVAVGDIGCLGVTGLTYGSLCARTWLALCYLASLFPFVVGKNFYVHSAVWGGGFSFFFVCPYFFGTVRFFGFLTYGGL